MLVKRFRCVRCRRLLQVEGFLTRPLVQCPRCRCEFRVGAVRLFYVPGGPPHGRPVFRDVN